ncbi:FkbM family methyltransferase [Maribius pontilimi]|uniref:FkbM family methyltransferase n=1 Tax=Palleronia pontilimi TaxID=1964209 RepID=A0A934I862_9RHOB|nr:FkbM family methyltransferase [Palleronia pontilimi]MBJ3762234.1 FkbM family methyltransferase [Palleronia pontilimi]
MSFEDTITEAQNSADLAALEADGTPRTQAERKAIKMVRRYRRNLRAAEAHAHLAGICSMLCEGDIVMDIGANLGEITAPLAETGARVVAYEPDPWTFAQLDERFAKNPNVELVNAAIGRKAGTVQLMRADNFDRNPQGASVKSTTVTGGRAIDESTAIDVEMRGFLDEVARLTSGGGGIAFCKMDIEGAELEILEDLVARRALDPIRCLVAETHEHKFKELRPRFRALRAAAAEAYPKRRLNLDWI